MRTIRALDLLPVGVLVAGVAVFFHPLLVHPGWVLYSPTSDLIDAAVPSHQRLVRLVQEHGSFPLLDPYVFSGFPMLGDLLSLSAYPPAWLSFLLPPEVALTWLFPLHFLLGALGTYFFARALGYARWPSALAGVVFAFSGKLVGHAYAGHVWVICAVAWLPWAFYGVKVCVHRGPCIRYASALGLIVGAWVLTGFVQVVYFGGLALIAYAIVLVLDQVRAEPRRGLTSLVYLGWAAVLGLGLALVLLVPAWSVAQESVRSSGLTFEGANQLALRSKHVVSLITGKPFLGPYDWGWERSDYLGLWALLLAAVATVSAVRTSQDRYFVVLAAIALVFSFGDLTYLFGIAHALVPGVDRFREPSRAMLIFNFAVAILAARGLNDIMIGRRVVGPSTWDVRTVFVLVGVGLAVAISLTALAIGGSISDLLFPVSPVVTLGAAALLGVCLWKGGARLFAPSLVALIFVDLWLASGKLIHVSDPELLFGETPVIRFLRNDPSDFRVLDLTNHLNHSRSGRHGIQLVGGYNPLPMRRYVEFIRLLDERPSITPRLEERISAAGAGDLSIMSAPALDRGRRDVLSVLGVKYVVAARSDDYPGLLPVFRDPAAGLWVLENADAKPKVFSVAEAMEVRDDGTAVLSALSRTDLRTIAVVNGESRLPERLAPVEVRTAAQGPGKRLLDVSASGFGLLVLSEPNRRGWVASLDGAEVPLISVDHVLQGVLVPPGTHRIAIEYRQPHLHIALWLSAVALLTGTLGLIRRRPSSRAGPEGSPA